MQKGNPLVKANLAAAKRRNFQENIDETILEILNEGPCTATELCIKMGYTNRSTAQKHLYRLVEKNLVTGWQGSNKSEKVWHTITFNKSNPASPIVFPWLPLPLPVEKFGKNVGSMREFIETAENLEDGFGTRLTGTFVSLFKYIALRAYHLTLEPVVDMQGHVMKNQQVSFYNDVKPKPADFKLMLKEYKEAADRFSNIITVLLATRELWVETPELWDRLDLTSEDIGKLGMKEDAERILKRRETWLKGRQKKEGKK